MRIELSLLGLAILAACPRPASTPDSGVDSGVDSGMDSGVDAGPADSGISYTPFYCADAGAGSAFDRHESFTAPDGTEVGVTICGPVSGGPVLTVSPPAYGGSAAALLAQAAVSAADGGAGTLRLTPGVYDFAGWDGGQNWAIVGAHDLLVDGQGSTLIFHDLKPGLFLRNDQRVLIRNLQIDWAEPLAVSGTLSRPSSSCDGGMAFEVDPAFPIDPANPTPLVSMAQFDVADRRWPLVPFAQAYWAQKPVADRAQYQSGQTYCVVDPQALASLPSGTAAIGISRTGGGGGVYVSGSGNVSLEHVSVYAAPGEGFTFYTGQRGFRMSQCRDVRPPLDAHRLISSNADGVNFRQTLGDVLLEDSEFANQGDDGVSILGQLFPVQAGSTATTVVLGQPAAATVQVGDSLSLLQSDFSPVDSALITTVVQVRDGGTQLGAIVQLAPPGFWLLGDGGTPLALDGGLLTNVPARSSPNFIFRNVFAHDNDQRALLVQTANGLVDRYTAANNRGIELVAQYGVFYEGPGASNVRVQNSVLTGCSFMTAPTALACAGGAAASPAPLSVLTLTPQHEFIPSRPHANLVLENNVISGAPGIGLLVSSATGVQVRNNTLVDTNQQTLTPSCGLFAVLPVGSMVALNATGVVFAGNIRDGGASEGLVVDPSCVGCSGQAGY